MSEDEKYLDSALRIKLNELNEEDSKKYIEFYDNVSNENLKRILSIYHNKLNSLFEYLNSRLINGHFTAHESRELISLIRDVEKLKIKLRGTSL
ncbi:hypothetical protein QYB73_001088 [Clostridium perfringens]|nr:hypothetical protein [Clostridium perfringens]